MRQKYFKENITVGTEKWRTQEERASFFLLVPRLFHSSGPPSPSVGLFSLWWKIWRAPCPVIKLLPERWGREIHHVAALVSPANPHHGGL